MPRRGIGSFDFGDVTGAGVLIAGWGWKIVQSIRRSKPSGNQTKEKYDAIAVRSPAPLQSGESGGAALSRPFHRVAKGLWSVPGMR